jgi:hypothetical protein
MHPVELTLFMNHFNSFHVLRQLVSSRLWQEVKHHDPRDHGRHAQGEHRQRIPAKKGRLETKGQARPTRTRTSEDKRASTRFDQLVLLLDQFDYQFTIVM